VTGDAVGATRATVVDDRVAVLKAVADPTRLQVLELLRDEGEHCHCELQEVLGAPANRLSFHLRVLRESGLVGSRRNGRRVYYHVHPGALQRLRDLLPQPVEPRQTGPCCGSDTQGVVA
jgi:ArsR family transcriptional regulator, arsenate/arsenite/antimonite-responsive transcriptional repressor